MIGRDRPVGEPRERVPHERLGRVGLLLDGARAEHRALDPQALGHEPSDLERRRDAGHAADEHDAALRARRRSPRRPGRRRPRGRARCRSGPAAATSCSANAWASSSRGASNAWSSPSATAASSLCGGARAPDGGQPERLAELDRRGPDTRADCRDEHHLAFTRAADGDHRVVRGEERLGHPAGRDEVERCRARWRTARPVPRAARPARRRRRCRTPACRSAGSDTPGPWPTTVPENSSPGMSAGDPGGAG